MSSLPRLQVLLCSPNVRVILRRINDLYRINRSWYISASLSREKRIAGSYLMMVGFHTPVWLVPSPAQLGMFGLWLSRGGRISILLTVFRVTPWRLQKKLLLGSTFLPPTSSPLFSDAFLQGLSRSSSCSISYYSYRGFGCAKLPVRNGKTSPDPSVSSRRSFPLLKLSVSRRVLLRLCSSSSNPSQATTISDGILVFTPLMVCGFPTPLAYDWRLTPTDSRSSRVSASLRCALAYLEFSPCLS